jgi:hypothetical protein
MFFIELLADLFGDLLSALRPGRSRRRRRR